MKEYYESCIRPQFEWIKRHKQGFGLFVGGLMLINGIILKFVTTHKKEEN